MKSETWNRFKRIRRSHTKWNYMSLAIRRMKRELWSARTVGIRRNSDKLLDLWKIVSTLGLFCE